MTAVLRALLFVTLFASSAMAQNAGSSDSEPTTPSRAVAGTHNCADFYPELSRRINESGDVLVRYDVLADGSIANVTLLKSSGSERLDRAALRCVTERWRNTPASRGGIAVASPGHEALIRFTLKGNALPPIDAGIARIVLIIVGVSLAGLFGLGIIALLLRRRGPPGAIRRTCPNCGTVNSSPDMLRPPKFCTNCGLALPEQ